MAKKTKKTSATVTLTSKDKKTLGSIRDLADGVVQSADRGRAPYVDIPSRSLSNVRFNQSKRIIEMGSGTNRRELFNLGQAKSYMQTLLVGSGCKRLIEQGKTNSAEFVLHVEKDTVWRRFNEDKFWREQNCILTHGGGQPPRGVRRMLHRLHYGLKLPVYCLLDNDPWGYYIYSVIKQGSINLAYESRRMAIPDARFLGLRSLDYGRCQLSPSVQIKLNEQDIKRTRQIAQYPWFVNKKPWQKEIELMLKNGFKLEVEALISKDISYVTEEYVPARLEEREFLD